MRILRPVLVAALCGVLGTLVGCGGDPPAAPAPSAAPTSLRQLQDSGLRVVRIAFCDLVPAKAVRAAVGTGLSAAVPKPKTWRRGGPLPVGGPAHEFGCSWRGPQGRVASAWVFGRPVTPAFARTVARAAGEDTGCRAALRHGFGEPGLVQTCARRGTASRVRRAGLFGDTWLTCEVSGRSGSAALRARTDAWCLAVVNALDAG